MLERGQLLEEGPPKDLLNDADSNFSKLAKELKKEEKKKWEMKGFEIFEIFKLIT